MVDIDASERTKTMALAIRTTNPTELCIKINLDGNLNNETVESFEQEIKRLLVNPLQTLVLDLQDLQFVSSSGIGALVKLKATLYSKKTELVTVNLPPQIQKVFEIMRLLPVLNVFEDVQELDHYLTKMQEKVIKENLE
jgi:anti-anti-sigma factor